MTQLCGKVTGDLVAIIRLQALANGATSGISTNILEDFPLLRGLIDRVMNLPAIDAYYSCRKETL